MNVSGEGRAKCLEGKARLTIKGLEVQGHWRTERQILKLLYLGDQNEEQDRQRSDNNVLWVDSDLSF